MYHLKLATYWTVLASSHEGAFHEAHLLLFGDQSFFCQDWCVWPFSQLALSLKTMQSVMLTLNGLAYLVVTCFGQTMSLGGPQYSFQFSQGCCFKVKRSARNCGAGNLNTSKCIRAGPVLPRCTAPSMSPYQLPTL